MSKRKSNKLAIGSSFSILAFVVGVALDVLYLVLSYFKTDEGQLLGKICIWVGLCLTVIGILTVAICIDLYRNADKRSKEQQSYSIDSGESPYQVGERKVAYVPTRETYEFVNMGKYQTLDDKFEQISKMDKTQFVIYVARLFSRKGYQVKLTPVVDNHDIDLLVEKMGVTIAVGCLPTNRVLGKDDIVCVKNGKRHYGVGNCMALTNMFFDRSAIDYAQSECMSLVDRNVLAEDFMN